MSSSEAHPPDHGGAVRAAIALAIAASGAGVAIWLARASVEIAAWPAGGLPRRVALHAPLSVLWLSLAFSAAAVAGAWWAARRGSAIGDGAGRAQGSLEVLTRLAHRLAPLTALWLWVVPFLPWLPDRCPLLLLLAGPIRWVLAAGAAAVVARSLSAVRGASWAWTAWRPGRRAVFVLSLVCYAVLGLRSLALIGLDGDEPHYLVITHSLLVDHDLQIENNHARGDYRAFFNRPLNPDYIQRGANGAIYSIHAPGLPAVLLPGYAAAGAMGAVLTMCLLAALAALAIFDVALAIGGPVTAWLTWAGACLTVPFIPHAWSLYPEMAAAAIVAWTVAWMVGCAKTATTSTSARTWMLRGLCLAWLPWLHTKFAILLAGLVLWLLIGPCRQRRDRAALLTPIALSGAAWLAFFAVTYGTLDPQAPYGLYLDGVLALANIPRSLVGMLVDQKFGLLIFAPVFVLGLFGAGELWRRSGAGPARGRRLLVGGLLAIPLAYWAGTSRLYMWWGGASAPARFLVPIVPLLAPLVAAALVPRASRARRAALVIVSVAIAAGGLVSPAGSHALLLFSDPHGTGRLLQAVQGSAPLTALLPTFTEEAWLPELAGLWPWLLAVSRVVHDRARRFFGGRGARGPTSGR